MAAEVVGDEAKLVGERAFVLLCPATLRRLPPTVGNHRPDQQLAAEDDLERRGGSGRRGILGAEVLAMQNEEREPTEHGDREQPTSDEGKCSPPAGGHRQQDDHSHHRDRTRERYRQPKRRDFGD